MNSTITKESKKKQNSASLKVKSSQGCTFGTRWPCSDKRIKHTSPGPLAYYIPDAITRYGQSNGPSFSIIGKGEASYKRPLNVLKDREAQGVPTGSRTKGSSLGNNTSPGPNNYELPSCIGLRNKGFSFGSRVYVTKKDGTPGPNMYKLPTCIGRNVPDKPSCRNINIVGRPRESRPKSGPGPAAYAPARNLNQMPSFSIGRKVTLKTNAEKYDTPAPNAYKQ